MAVKLEEKKEINARSLTLSEFLCERELINIPRYQREYSWDKGNINAFLSDIQKDYYLGNIICYKHASFSEIIDGQQRIITTFLVLIALRNLLSDDSCKDEIDKLIYCDGKCKLQLKDRIGSDGQNILNYILDNVKSIPDPVKKYSEIENYFLIEKMIKSQDLKKIYSNLVNSIIVEVSFTKSIDKAYEMFVNINTKGKPLAEIEILKSQLFKYLLSGRNSDTYKENWQEMLKNIPKKEYATFVSDTYLFYLFSIDLQNESIKTNGTVKENFSLLIKEIDKKQKAAQIFYLMTGEELENVYYPYVAVKNYDLESLKNNYYRNLETSLSRINGLWNLYGEYGFVQSDILFVSLLKDKETFIKNNVNYLYTFMLYLFLYEISRSIIGTSPAHYSNSFKQLAKSVYNEKDPSKLKKILKQFICNRLIDTENLKTKLQEKERFLKNYKTAKFIIMLVEENLNKNLTVEHFIIKKTPDEKDKQYVGYLGNLIPVIRDVYKDRGVKEKIEMYERDSISDISIKEFLKYDFDENNYKEKIELRTKELSEKFADMIVKSYNELMK